MSLTTTALVLESNGVTYFDGNEVLRAGSNVGITMPIPTPDGGGWFQGDYWVSPINDGTAVTGMTFTPYNLNSGLPAKPHPYSLAACKIRFTGVTTNGKEDYWFVLGTSAQWASGTLPTNSSLVYWGIQQGARPVVDANGLIVSGSFEFTLGIPSQTASPAQQLFPVGYYNDVALPASATNGYSNLASLLSFLNSNWNVFGSPSITVTWSASPNSSSIKGTFTDNSTDQNSVPINDVLTAFVFAIV